MAYVPPTHTQLIAHRGNSGPSPENTRLAVEQAISIGVDMVEADVNLALNGDPVIIHNATLAETTNGKGRVDENSLAELKKLDAGSWKGPEFAGERILGLYDLLALARGRIPLNLDLKTSKAIPATLKAVRDMRMLDQVAITGCTYTCVKAVREQEPRVTTLLDLESQIFWLLRKGSWDLLRKACLTMAQISDCAGLNLHHAYIDHRLVEQLKRRKIWIWAWTIDESTRALELLEFGVDSITTNWPERMAGLLRRKPQIG